MSARTTFPAYYENATVINTYPAPVYQPREKTKRPSGVGVFTRKRKYNTSEVIETLQYERKNDDSVSYDFFFDVLIISSGLDRFARNLRAIRKGRFEICWWATRYVFLRLVRPAAENARVVFLLDGVIYSTPERPTRGSPISSKTSGKNWRIRG